ncbi:MAG: hypothetical protein BGN85_00320 [Alphaproteobacteria bacterium 64-11]|nr:hypothetical protein [Alphaproteobacteria bacterium]OJU14319.1 MAG: hypothetical protein BGN85_00320 [Alphaproteobacteria bacterium 64-11]
MPRFDFQPHKGSWDAIAGFRDGARGTHSSRTIMLDELSRLAANSHLRGDIKKAVVEENALGKSTSSGRTLTLQRLKELYSFDPSVPLFRVFTGLYHRDPTAMPQLALLMAMARDPLLRASARPIVGLAPGSELTREALRNAVGAVVGGRMNEAVLDKVVRNTASSWTKTGHLVGRTIKRRARIRPNTTAFAFALWLAHKTGFTGADLFENAWISALDIEAAAARSFAERAHAAGLIRFRTIGDGFELDVTPLERRN